MKTITGIVLFLLSLTASATETALMIEYVFTYDDGIGKLKKSGDFSARLRVGRAEMFMGIADNHEIYGAGALIGDRDNVLYIPGVVYMYDQIKMYNRAEGLFFDDNTGLSVSYTRYGNPDEIGIKQFGVGIVRRENIPLVERDTTNPERCEDKVRGGPNHCH